MSIEVDEVSASYRVRIDSPDLVSDMRRLLRRSGSSDRLIPALRDVSFNGAARIGAGGHRPQRRRQVHAVPGDQRGPAARAGPGRRAWTAQPAHPGLGFSEALTGRENITLGGLASGMSPARLAELTEEIAEFAQLEEYLDLPMRSYSGGMRMRLASSVAVFLDPEILLIDEALTGGDTAFQAHIAERTAQAHRRRPHDRAGDPRPQLGEDDGHTGPLAAPGPGRRVRRPRRGRQQVHALLPHRVARAGPAVTATNADT